MLGASRGGRGRKDSRVALAPRTDVDVASILGLLQLMAQLVDVVGQVARARPRPYPGCHKEGRRETVFE